MSGNKQSLALLAHCKQSWPLYGKKLLFFLLLLAPVLIVFKSFFLSFPLVWGDAPYFFPEALKELVGEPLIWTHRGLNFGGVNLLIFISPLMYLHGLLGSVLKLGNDLTIRLVFYLPSLLLSLIGPYLLVRHFSLPKIVGFSASFVFVLNTYYLLLIDGGQVGIAVAYGLFPFVVLTLSKYIDSVNLKNFLIAVLVLMLEIIFDPRIAIICLLTFALLRLSKNLIKIIPIVILGVMLSSFWLVPLLEISINAPSLSVSSLNLSSLINGLFIFAPHWPANIFGEIISPYFYFSFIPFLIFGSLLFTKNKKMVYYTLLFLLFAFLAKGTTPPLGEVYNFFITKFPFGSAFRDESKFFIPLVLIGGILIGETLNVIQSKSKIFALLAYIYLVLLISPALLGKMNFVLSERNQSVDHQIIYQNLKNESNVRSVWFPEKSSLGFVTSDNQGLDAKSLIENRPFASLNVGEDVFNFMHNPEYLTLFRTLGIKYMIIADDPRKVNLSRQDVKNAIGLESLVATTSGLRKVDWGTNYSIYDTGSIMPRLFKSEKLFAVVGPQLHLSSNYLPAVVYLEDGKFNPQDVINANPAATVLVLNRKSTLDLAMSLLQNYFLPANQNTSSQWVIYQRDDYLKYKYELLTRGYQFDDFDYGKGLAFSTIKGESIKFKFEVKNSGNYVFAQRIGDMKKQNLYWAVEEMYLTGGVFEPEIKNDTGIKVLNVVALIPKEEFEKANSNVVDFAAKIKTVDEKQIQTEVDNNIVEPISIDKISQTNYSINQDKISKKGYWVVFTDTYHNLWKLKHSGKLENSVPIYSMVNGFFIDPSWEDVQIIFLGQNSFRKGVLLSLITLSLIVLVSLGILISKCVKNYKKRN